MVEKWDAARTVAGKASERTLKDNRRWLKHVEKYIGEMPIADITAQVIEDVYAKIKKDRQLSGTSMARIHMLLKNVFQKAINYDFIYKNPCTHVEAPQPCKPNRRSLTADEGSRLLKAVDASEAAAYMEMDDKESRRVYREEHNIARQRYALRGMHHIGNVIAIRIGLATGMRRGEVFALNWKNVNLEIGSIRVCQSITVKGAFKHPKSDAGIRTLAIDSTTVSHLAYWKARQAEELSKIGIEQSDAAPVCCSDLGGWYKIDNFEHWWREWRKENGFHNLKFHELRHTQATQLLANGVDIKTVQTRLGHANSSITLGWYAHAIPENDHEAANLLERLFASDESSCASVNTAFPDISQMSPECPLGAHLPEEKKKVNKLEFAC